MIKKMIREITPPVLWQSALKFRNLLVGRDTKRKFGAEQPPEFYDQSFEESDHWKKHYTLSHYYPLWTIIADRIRSLGVNKILDIGCGPGQVARLLYDIGVKEYKGLDFSTARIAMARTVCPAYEFYCADVFKDDLLETYDYDCVLIMEFLEHVDQDIDLLTRVRPGTPVLATVPNFAHEGHVRHFNSVAEVESRYSSVLSQLNVATVLKNEGGITYYVLQGTR